MTTTTDTTFKPGDTVRYFENGFRAGVVREVTNRRSGGVWYHLIIEDGRTKKFGDTEVSEANDNRMKRLRAMTPAEADEAREAYLKVAIERADRNRAEWQDTTDSTQEGVTKTRGRTAAPASDDKVNAFIAAVEKFKAASKKQVQGAMGTMTASEWNKTVAAVLETGKVEVHGKRRGTKYTVPGYKVERVQPQDDTKVKDYAEKVLVGLKADKHTAVARADILDAYPTDNGTYQAAMKLLVESGKVVKTGAKRGTRYHVS